MEAQDNEIKPYYTADVASADSQHPVESALTSIPSLDERLTQTFENVLKGNTLTKIVEETLTETLQDIVNDLFKSYGGVYSALRNKIEEHLVSYIKSYDITKYIPKLDSILTTLLSDSSLIENKKVLENFQLMLKPYDVSRMPDSLSELFELYTKWVSKNVATYGLEVVFKPEPLYESVEVSMNVEPTESCYSAWEYAMLQFRCEHDEECNIDVPMHRYSPQEPWILDFNMGDRLSSLRNMTEFKLLLTKLTQSCHHIKDDSPYYGYFSDDIYPEDKPEPTYS